MSRPLVSVVIIHHENAAQPYLDRCLESLKHVQKHNIELEVLVIASCIEEPTVPDWVRLFRISHDISGPIATNFGASKIHSDSQYILHANDDVIFSHASIENMVALVKGRRVIINPFSNCDCGWLYEADLNFYNVDFTKKLEQKRFYRLEEVKGFESDIMSFKADVQSRQTNIGLRVPQLCMYATLFPRALWEELGGYDINFIICFNDTDLSLRAKEKGIGLLVALGAFVFHYGGVTTSSEDGFKPVKDDIRLQDQNYFISKWGMDMFKRIAGTG